MSLYGSKGGVEWAYKDHKIRMLWNVQLKTAITGQVRNFLALYIKEGKKFVGKFLAIILQRYKGTMWQIFKCWELGAQLSRFWASQQHMPLFWLKKHDFYCFF